MKENIEELRANVERTEMAGLKFIATRAACARAALDYIAQLEQTSRAQRTTEGECNSAAAPADRDAILEDAALQCEAEKVHVQKWHPSSDGDEAYNAGCDDCAKAIRALKSMERAADATDEQPTDKALLDDLDAWVRQNKEAGCEWFNFAFDTKSTARQQLAADMALRAADAAETRDAKGGEHE